MKYERDEVKVKKVFSVLMENHSAPIQFPFLKDQHTLVINFNIYVSILMFYLFVPHIRIFAVKEATNSREAMQKRFLCILGMDYVNKNFTVKKIGLEIGFNYIFSLFHMIKFTN